MTVDERKILEYLSEDHKYKTSDYFGELYATNPYILVARELGFSDSEYVKGIIDKLADGGYIENYAAVRLHITDDGVLQASITTKGRQVIE